MTTPASPHHRKLASDVAKQLDRRSVRRKLLVWGVIIAAIVAAVMYLRCGRGWGIGGEGKGAGAGAGGRLTVDAGPSRCAIRIAANGITVDRKVVTRAEAVALCKRSGAADVIVTGDARQGDWNELRAALAAANITIYEKQPASQGP